MSKYKIYYFLLIFVQSGIAFCAKKEITNLTPASEQRNVSNLYEFSAHTYLKASRSVKNFEFDVFIDGKKYILLNDENRKNVYYYDFLINNDNVEAKYYFQMSYDLHKNDKVYPVFEKTELYTLKIAENNSLILECMRAPIDGKVKLLGFGFSGKDKILIGNKVAKIEILSENVISFNIPRIVGDKLHSVFYIKNDKKMFVGNMFIDAKHFKVNPAAISVFAGCKIPVTIALDYEVQNQNLPINITTNISDNKIVIPEAEINIGKRYVTINIECLEPVSGELYINSIGYKEKVIPIKIFSRKPNVRSN